MSAKKSKTMNVDLDGFSAKDRPTDKELAASFARMNADYEAGKTTPIHKKTRIT